MKEYYENRVAAVTGGASGIGLALCEMLLALGAKAVIMADLNAEKLKVESARLDTAYPGKVLGIETDVANEESVSAMVRKAADFGDGRMDFLFNNAGLALNKAFDEATNADWKFALDVNFFGAVYGIRAALPIMRAQGGGHIANTASGIAYAPMAYQSMYSATKAALTALTGSLRYEFWDENIRFSTVIPGTVATPIWGKSAPASAISPEESARLILEGIAKNERIVITTDDDRKGAIYAFHPEAAESMDKYLLDVARRRRKGEEHAI